ncbi:MAG: SAM-dependent methyltransferase, partial [Thermodesulfobacteriota bacterium]
MNRPAGFRLYAALFLSSLATLGFEVLLTRIFSIALWYHFGHMVVSIAMLGLGLSGTFWALRRRPSGNGIPNPRPELFMLLAMSMVGAYLLAVRIPFDPVRLSWDRGQLWLVGLYYVTLSVPFFFAGLILVTAFSAPGSRSGFVYGSD